MKSGFSVTEALGKSSCKTFNGSDHTRTGQAEHLLIRFLRLCGKAMMNELTVNTDE
jgi:hypothetical protein